MYTNVKELKHKCILIYNLLFSVDDFFGNLKNGCFGLPIHIFLVVKNRTPVLNHGMHVPILARKYSCDGVELIHLTTDIPIMIAIMKSNAVCFKNSFIFAISMIKNIVKQSIEIKKIPLYTKFHVLQGNYP